MLLGLMNQRKEFLVPLGTSPICLLVCQRRVIGWLISAAGDTAGDQALGEAGRESPAVDTGECLCVRLVFLSSLVDVSMSF